MVGANRYQKTLPLTFHVNFLAAYQNQGVENLPDRSTAAVYMANHQSTVDLCTIFCLPNGPPAVSVAKSSMVFLPGFGSVPTWFHLTKWAWPRLNLILKRARKARLWPHHHTPHSHVSPAKRDVGQMTYETCDWGRSACGTGSVSPSGGKSRRVCTHHIRDDDSTVNTDRVQSKSSSISYRQTITQP